MTSDEIKRTKTIPDLVIAGESQSFWLRELALQMAILNERNERMDEYNAAQDIKDAEAAERRAAQLPEFLKKADQTLDRIGKPFSSTQTVGPFSVPGNKQQ